ncbi:MAG TPA: hypothetical protein VLY04_01855 [Bryobacteraceae bacterium]|nr:hypothetical protein [Bryobacteraceae bacterium]
MNRRVFLKHGARVVVGVTAGSALAVPGSDAEAPEFRTANERWQAAYDRALDVLAANVRVLPRFAKPVLIEGANYAGVWLECGPHEGLVYRKFRPDVARNGHLTFFELQRPDGQFPANNKVSETGFGQIQMVVPIAATAWELAQATGDDELLHTAYRACSAWDDWLMRHRNTRGMGLVEGFCTYDTGHDNSPRWAGIPPQCPEKDAKRHYPIETLPRLCPDLSATVYGGRIALSAMAKAMGNSAEADRWTESAQKIRSLILSRLYVPEDAAFYDLDAQNHFVKIRCDILSRMCGEHIPDQALFDDLWTRQIHNARAFWTPYPLPSVALDDPLFVRPIPRNSWGGASQALTALRAGRWFDHYGRSAEFGSMMDRWCEAIQRDMTFRQQMDPLNGVFTREDAPAYSPAALVMMDYTWRLAGVREEHDSLHWNVRPGHPAAESARFRVRTDAGQTAEMRYDEQSAELWLAGKPLGRIESGVCRLVTDKAGVPQSLLGISEQQQRPVIRLVQRAPREVTLQPNQRIAL